MRDSKNKKIIAGAENAIRYRLREKRARKNAQLIDSHKNTGAKKSGERCVTCVLQIGLKSTGDTCYTHCFVYPRGFRADGEKNVHNLVQKPNRHSLSVLVQIKSKIYDANTYAFCLGKPRLRP